jgi:hypothetical protein
MIWGLIVGIVGVGLGGSGFMALSCKFKDLPFHRI